MCVHNVVYKNNWNQLSHQRIYFSVKRNFLSSQKLVFSPQLKWTTKSFFFLTHYPHKLFQRSIGICVRYYVSRWDIIMGEIGYGDPEDSRAVEEGEGRELITEGLCDVWIKLQIFSEAKIFFHLLRDTFSLLILKEILHLKNDCAFLRFWCYFLFFFEKPRLLFARAHHTKLVYFSFWGWLANDADEGEWSWGRNIGFIFNCDGI